MKNVLIDMKNWLNVAIEAEQLTDYLRTEFTGLWMLWANVSGSFAELLWRRRACNRPGSAG